MERVDAKKLLLAAGVVLGTGAVIYVLGQRTNESRKLLLEAEDRLKKKSRSAAAEITKEQVNEILQEIIANEDDFKVPRRAIIEELIKEPLALEQVYKRVQTVMPNDPLDRYGLSMMDFDQLLQKHQSDEHVKRALNKLMGAPDAGSSASEKVQGITVSKIIELHNFMLAEMDKLAQEFQDLQNKDPYQSKVVTVAVQLIVNAKIESKFGITSEDVESAVLMYHTMLATDQEFAAINIKIQHTMGKLMSTPFASS